jgi:hypothetical protein
MIAGLKAVAYPLFGHDVTHGAVFGFQFLAEMIDEYVEILRLARVV